MKAIKWARGVRGVSPAEKVVLLLLADHAGSTCGCWPSVARLAEDACLSERTVQRALAGLEAAGLISREGNGGRNRTCTYTLKGVEKGDNDDTDQAAERVTTATERVTSTAERVTSTTERVTQCHPNPQEPPGTPRNPQKKGVQGVEPPAWLPPKAWDDWCRHRKGKLWTPKAQELSIRNLAEYRANGDDPVLVIEQSIANGWRGLFPLKRPTAPPRRESKLAWMLDPNAGLGDLGNVVGFAR